MFKKGFIKVLLSSMLIFNIFTVQAFAFDLDAGKPDTPSSNGSGFSNGSSVTPTKPSGNGGNSNWNKPSSSSGNSDRLYYYSTYDWDMKVAFDSFCGWGTNGSTMTYKDRRGTGGLWYDKYTDTWYEDYFPAVKFKKWHNTKVQEESRVTDYYTWKCTGPESWEVRDGRYKSVVFHKTGKYTVTSIPHQVVTTSSQLFYTSEAFDVFSDGTYRTINYASGSNPKEYTTKYIDRTDLKRQWTFEITPDEVDKPIPLNPDKPDGGNGEIIEVDRDTLDLDTELIH